MILYYINNNPPRISTLKLKYEWSTSSPVFY